MSPHQRVLILRGVGGEVAADPVRPRRGGRVGDGGLLPPLRGPAARSRRRASAGRPAYGSAGGRGGAAPHAPAGRRNGPWTPHGRPGSPRRARRPRWSRGDGPGQVLVEGGTGDLQQLARPLDVAPASLLRLDERVDVHRVSLAKKAVARLRISTSSRSRRFSRRSSASSCRSSVVRPPSLAGPRVAFGLLDPLPHRGLGQVKVLRDLADGPVPALAQLNDLGLELRGERTAAPGLLPHALHDRTSFRGQTPDDGCPSKRVRPNTAARR